MGFTSYAQNFEDVMLWRALGHITDGVYVDVGAQHPRIDSISRAFYERGWRGVHIEPVPAFAEMLRQDRPDETVLQVALGEREGTLELNVFPDTGLSTAIASYAERHRTERQYEAMRIEVPVLTLRSALGSLADKQVHWLKIDVEGFEEQVLRGWDSARLRPWILVVEATVPNSTDTDYDKWDPLVTAAGYRFVYFDGLNRFYIADEHPELAAAFAAPPNVFDTFEVSGLASWGLCNFALAGHEGRIKELDARLDASTRAAAAAEARVRECEAELAAAAVHAGEFAVQAAALSEQLAKSVADAAAAGQHLAQVESMLKERDQLHAALGRDLAAAESKATELEHRAYYWWHSAEELRRQLDQVRDELRLVYNSKSWRVSAPLRLFSVQARRGRLFAGRVLRWAMRQPARVRNAVSGKAGTVGARSQVVVMSQPTATGAPRRLSPRAARLYTELKQIVEKGSD